MALSKLIIEDTQEKINLASDLLRANNVRFTQASSGNGNREEKLRALAQRFREKPALTGHGEELSRLRKEFRDDFVM